MLCDESGHTLSTRGSDLTFCSSPSASSPGFSYLINQLSFPRSEQEGEKKINERRLCGEREHNKGNY